MGWPTQPRKQTQVILSNSKSLFIKQSFVFLAFSCLLMKIEHDQQHVSHTKGIGTSQELIKQMEPLEIDDKRMDGPKSITKSERLKSTFRQIFIGLIISLSAINYGISLKQITAIPMATLVHLYDIPINKFAAQSILIGVLPFGAIFGVLFTKLLITRYRRLAGIYLFTVVNIGAMVLVNINTFETFIAGRFVEGICIGYYTQIAPIYLKEIAPKELRRLLGLFFSFGKILGVILITILELIFDAAPFDIDYRILLSLTGFFSTVQAILIFFFGSDTPTEMIEKGKDPEARKIIQNFYHEEYVEEIFRQYKKEYEMQMAKGKETQSQELNHKEYDIVLKEKKTSIGVHKKDTEVHIQSEPYISHNMKANLNKMKEPSMPDVNKESEPPTLTYDQKKKYAYFMGLHLCIIRHWLAGNLIITQGGQFITTFDASLGKYTPLIINLVQFVFVIVGLVYIQKVVGKRPLFLFSVSTLSLVNLGLGISMMYYQVIASEMIMIIYMIIYGASFISPIWSYPAEVIPASQALIPNIVHWTALALQILIPPLIAGSMPNNNAYPVFFFFGIYGIFGFIHVFRCLKETDGLNYNEIIKSYR